MKKTIALILALVMVFALFTACGNNNQPNNTGGDQPGANNPGAPSGNEPGGSAPSGNEPGGSAPSGGEPSGTGLEGKKIGLMMYSTTTPWAINIIETVETLCGEFGMTCQVAEAGNPGEIIAAVENLLAANIDGMLCAMDGGIANQVMALCAQQGVYTTFAWTDNLTVDFYPEIAANEYYAGSINSKDFDAAYEMTQYCIDRGADQWVFLGMPEGSGNANDNRALGFKQCLADNGLELLSEARTYDKVEGSQNLITNFPNLNGFGSGLNAAKNASGALETAGKFGEVYMFCYEAAEDYVQDYFDQGALHGSADGISGHVELALAQLCNALTGNRLVDANGEAYGYACPYIIAHTGEDYAALIANAYNGNMIFNVDELKTLIAAYNPGVTADDFQKVIDNYSMEDLIARRS